MKYLSGQQIRMMWLDFFKGKGHHVEKGASLIPYKDPSLLWMENFILSLICKSVTAKKDLKEDLSFSLEIALLFIFLLSLIF